VDRTWEPWDVQELLDMPTPDYDWLVPDLLERQDRIIIVGREGKGKSTLLRQFGYQLACGIHPFTLEPVTPVRVLYVDLENPVPATRRALSKLYDKAKPAPGLFSGICLPAGVDLTRQADRLGMQTLMAMARPELLVLGPMYKLGCDLNTEESSMTLIRQLDGWREQFNCALLMEAHQPQESLDPGGAGRYRRMSPIGSSAWLRWPEFGFCLTDNGTLFRFRGNRDADRPWPETLHWGKTWPWESQAQLCLYGTCTNLAKEHGKYCCDAHSNAARQSRSRMKVVSNV